MIRSLLLLLASFSSFSPETSPEVTYEPDSDLSGSGKVVIEAYDTLTGLGLAGCEVGAFYEPPIDKGFQTDIHGQATFTYDTVPVTRTVTACPNVDPVEVTYEVRPGYVTVITVPQTEISTSQWASNALGSLAASLASLS